MTELVSALCRLLCKSTNPAVDHRGYETSRQSRFDAQYWMLGAGALGRLRGMVRGGRREEGSAWGTRVYLWWIHVDIWQNQYNIVKLKKKSVLIPFVRVLPSLLSHLQKATPPNGIRLRIRFQCNEFWRNTTTQSIMPLKMRKKKINEEL